MARLEECVLYRNQYFEQGQILLLMTELMNKQAAGDRNLEESKRLFHESAHGLIELAGTHGFCGNLWQNYLTFLLVSQENAFSLACEREELPKGSICEAARNDFAIFKELYDYDLEVFDKLSSVSYGKLLMNYQNTDGRSRFFHRQIQESIGKLSQKLAKVPDADAFMQEIAAFYQEFGVGKLGLHKAFRIGRDEEGQVDIRPITNLAPVHLEDLVGYETAKQKLVDNTEAFVEGRKANNCLLFGDAGTGKSSSIKAILNRYYGRGLRMIEIYKHQIQDLNDVIAQIKNRNYKFILYMDDLSFEDFEVEYKYLKAVIEGGLEEKPDNVLIYATSNRRHLIRENFDDKEGRREDLHASDTVQEKLSLVYRFGVTIFFCAPNKKEFQNIVSVLAKRHHLEIPEEELLLEANRWELNHGGLTGRTAQQFIDYLLGQKKPACRLTGGELL